MESLKINELNQLILVAGEEVLTLAVSGRSDLSTTLSNLTSAVQPDYLFRDVFTALDRTPIHIALSGGSFYYMWQPEVIPMICTVTTDADGTLIPELGPEDANKNALVPLTWRPPIPLFYLMCPTFDGKWKLGELYFFGLHNKQVWRPPLPNCFEDGRACHNTSGGPGFPTVSECLEWIMAHMRDSVWNSHLRQDATQQWVRFKPKGKSLEQIDNPLFIKNPAEGKLRIVGNKIISSIAELWLLSNKTPAE